MSSIRGVVDDGQIATFAVSLAIAVVAVLVILGEFGATTLGTAIVVAGVVIFAQLVKDVVTLSKS